MRKQLWSFLAVLYLSCPLFCQEANSLKNWQIFITNDTCPDVTWGLTETQTRKAFADLILSHLDQMNRSDNEPPENREHYNMAATYELFSFLEYYPGRKEELFRRIREGRILVSPFLCNSLWGWQSAEGVLRTLYPARRLELEHQIPIEIGHHIELPSLPWGMAPLLAGSGIRWLLNPFYDYDSTFKGLTNPPLFYLEGPDGSRLAVDLDPYSCSRGSYSQGSMLLKEPQKITGEWIPHYQQLGSAYPLTSLLASGTHSDISPKSGEQTAGFFQSIRQYNAAAGNQPLLRNATLADFFAEVDAAQAKHPFMKSYRGDFGHSWELWPVSLAKIAADARIAEQDYLAAETLVSLAGIGKPVFYEATREQREKAEWNWAMLSDHAWNGTDDANKKHNAQLRRDWCDQMVGITRELTGQAWQQLGLEASPDRVTLFNPSSLPGDYLVVLDLPAGMKALRQDRQNLSTQVVDEEGKKKLYLVLKDFPGFSFRELKWESTATKTAPSPFHFEGEVLEGPFYRLVVDPQTGGLKSLVHKASGQELVDRKFSRTLLQTHFYDGRDHPLTGIKWELLDQGQVMARLKISGETEGIRVETLVTLYAALDRVDFDTRLEKLVTSFEQRLCQFFPLGAVSGFWRMETPGAVVRPRSHPEGDLLAGADPRRFAVQNFVDYSPPGRPGVTVVPWEAFCLRLDLDSPSFEIAGNDQNYREVNQDQFGESHFRFRYSLRAHPPGYDQASVLAWSRQVRNPVLVAAGRLPAAVRNRPPLLVDPTRAIATCLKPSLEKGSSDLILRLWEIKGDSAPVRIKTGGVTQVFQTDLLERQQKELPVQYGTTSVRMPGFGFAALRLKL
jgi:hypothetical protein